MKEQMMPLETIIWAFAILLWGDLRGPYRAERWMGYTGPTGPLYFPLLQTLGQTHFNRFCRSTNDFFVGPGWSRFRSVSQTNQAKDLILHLLHAKESGEHTGTADTHGAVYILGISYRAKASILLSRLFFSPLVRHYFHMVLSIIRENCHKYR